MTGFPALSELLSSVDFDENGQIEILSLRAFDRAYELLLEIETGNDGEAPQVWLIRCEELRAYRIVSEFVDNIELVSEHALLAPFVQPHAKLSFSGRPKDASSVVGDLWLAHRKVMDDWYGLADFCNPSVQLEDLLRAGSGVLAEGPVSLLEAYASALHLHDIETSLFAQRPPLRWLEGAWQPESSDLRVILLGESYVIGAGFSARRSSRESLEG